MSILNAFNDNVRNFPDKVALNFIDPSLQRVIYAELDELVDQTTGVFLVHSRMNKPCIVMLYFQWYILFNAPAEDVLLRNVILAAPPGVLPGIDFYFTAIRYLEVL